jgi:thioredoxin-like negative regulator of GroEL
MLDSVNSKESIEELKNKNEMVLIYFGSNSCDVCNAVKPKVENLFKKYPKIKNALVDVEKSLEVSAAYNIFTIPAVLVFIENKEIIREARHISMQDIDSKINRFYNMIFEE